MPKGRNALSLPAVEEEKSSSAWTFIKLETWVSSEPQEAFLSPTIALSHCPTWTVWARFFWVLKMKPELALSQRPGLDLLYCPLWVPATKLLWSMPLQPRALHPWSLPQDSSLLSSG